MRHLSSVFGWPVSGWISEIYRPCRAPLGRKEELSIKAAMEPRPYPHPRERPLFTSTPSQKGYQKLTSARPQFASTGQQPPNPRSPSPTLLKTSFSSYHLVTDHPSPLAELWLPKVFELLE
jgi:hypothetical protein